MAPAGLLSASFMEGWWWQQGQGKTYLSVIICSLCWGTPKPVFSVYVSVASSLCHPARQLAGRKWAMAQCLLNSCPILAIVLSSRMNRYGSVSQGPYCPMQKKDKQIKTTLNNVPIKAQTGRTRSKRRSHLCATASWWVVNVTRALWNSCQFVCDFRRPAGNQCLCAALWLLTCKSEIHANNHKKGGRRPWSNRWVSDDLTLPKWGESLAGAWSQVTHVIAATLKIITTMLKNKTEQREIPKQRARLCLNLLPQWKKYSLLHWPK